MQLHGIYSPILKVVEPISIKEWQRFVPWSRKPCAENITVYIYVYMFIYMYIHTCCSRPLAWAGKEECDVRVCGAWLKHSETFSCWVVTKKVNGKFYARTMSVTRTMFSEVFHMQALKVFFFSTICISQYEYFFEIHSWHYTFCSLISRSLALHFTREATRRFEWTQHFPDLILYYKLYLQCDTFQFCRHNFAFTCNYFQFISLV